MLTLREFSCWRWVNCWLGVSLSINSAFDRLIDSLLIASWILMVLMIISIQFLLTLSFWLPRSFSIGHLKVLLGLKTLVWLPTWTNLSERDSVQAIYWWKWRRPPPPQKQEEVKMLMLEVRLVRRKTSSGPSLLPPALVAIGAWAYGTAFLANQWKSSLKILAGKKRINWASSRFQVFPLLEIHRLEAFL